MNAGQVKAHAVTADQAEELKRLLEAHFRRTASRRAEAILSDFDRWLPRFRAVMSDEYLNYIKGA